MSKRKNIKPGFDALETREVLSSFSPLMRAMPMGYGSPGPTNNPIVTLHGGSPNSIGGSAGVTVMSNNPNYAMTKIVYTVGGAIATQTFDLSKGDFTTYSGITHTDPNGKQTDMASWFWDQTVGSRSIKVDVTYNDTAKTVKSTTLTINVGKPDIESFTISGHAYHMGKPRPETLPPGKLWYGTNNDDFNGAAGIKMKTKVTSVPSSGEFGIVQIATKFDTVVEDSKYRKTVKLPAGSLLLDRVKGSPNPGLNNIWDAYAPYEGASSLLDRTDSPALYADISLSVPTSEYLTKMTMDYAFDTYVVWHPSGGIYVAVDHVSWTEYASATYNGSTDPQKIDDEYQKASNWTIVSTPNGDWPKIGDKSTKLLKWTNNLTDGTPKAVVTLK